jgi:hypothetical protein
LSEAVGFLGNLDDKTREKIYYTIKKAQLVIATHGILTKTPKAPPKEINNAEEIRKQHLSNKAKNK